MDELRNEFNTAPRSFPFDTDFPNKSRFNVELKGITKWTTKIEKNADNIQLREKYLVFVIIFT